MKYFFATCFIVLAVIGVTATILDIFYIYGVLTK